MHSQQVNSPFYNKLSYPTVNVAEAWINAEVPEPEDWAEAAGALVFAPNVNTPDGLLFVKLKFVVLLLPNWKMEPKIVKRKKLHQNKFFCNFLLLM